MACSVAEIDLFNNQIILGIKRGNFLCKIFCANAAEKNGETIYIFNPRYPR